MVAAAATVVAERAFRKLVWAIAVWVYYCLFWLFQCGLYRGMKQEQAIVLRFGEYHPHVEIRPGILFFPPIERKFQRKRDPGSFLIASKVRCC